MEAPYGYILNPNEQKVTFTYVDDKTPVIKERLTFSDDRQKLDMSVTKLDAEDNTPIAGAVFGLYADEDIKNVDGKVIIEKGTLLEKATSDENGNVDVDNRFTVYGIRDLGTELSPITMLVMMESIQNRIVENGKRGKATWLYIDEFHGARRSVA